MTEAGSLNSFNPTHLVPAWGLASYEGPSLDRPVVALDPGLPVEVVERSGYWARVRCSNGWQTWVDGRQLTAETTTADAPEGPGASSTPVAFEAKGVPEGDEWDLNGLRSKLEEALTTCRGLLADWKAGVLDEDGFRRRALEAGLVTHNDAIWILDLLAGHWLRYDGLSVQVPELHDA